MRAAQMCIYASSLPTNCLPLCINGHNKTTSTKVIMEICLVFPKFVTKEDIQPDSFERVSWMPFLFLKKFFYFTIFYISK